MMKSYPLHINQKPRSSIHYISHKIKNGEKDENQMIRWKEKENKGIIRVYIACYIEVNNVFIYRVGR